MVALVSVRGKIVAAWATLVIGELVIVTLTVWACWIALHPPLIEALVVGPFLGVIVAAMWGVASVLWLRRLHAMGEEGKQ